MALNATVFGDMSQMGSGASGVRAMPGMENESGRPPKVPFPNQRYEVADLLKACVEHKSSDLHLAVGRPPVLRINGDLRDVDGPVLTPARVPPFDLRRAQRHAEAEVRGAQGTGLFALGDQHGPLPRQYPPATRDRGRRFARDRLQDSQLRGFALADPRAGLPGAQAQRIRFDHGPDRVGQVNHAGGDGGSNQPGARLPHHYDRRPHRVSSLAQARPDRAARGQ